MSFTKEIKKLSKFLKEQGFLAVPMEIRNMTSWVKELDSENLVYMYVYVSQHSQESQRGHLIISPPRYNDDSWIGNPLAIGIPLAENWELGAGFFDDYINRLTNLLPSVVYLKDAVIREMHNISNISTQASEAKALGERELIDLKAFHKLKKEPNFTKLCQISKEIWFTKKDIYLLDTELGKKCFEPYGDDITMKYIEDYTSKLSTILATYSAFR
ncbi:hypothetical protein [Capnocytophaga cynodegmi]|uniref:Uncharacterized protein n=1 Tax=Capnocytophaga cynodegmi TaxID=28189 RepID=A0A0B7HLA6_9FLAO|nr:hypothetical protein [Capnocytophaga cynodegmi]ATA68427.1 hypothetical protein CGC48_07160 [Capnocytophaga cynodegmi]CEN38278.1 conserved hypothetical protein [Capnocytophaga cynodegmi]